MQSWHNGKAQQLDETFKYGRNYVTELDTIQQFQSAKGQQWKCWSKKEKIALIRAPNSCVAGSGLQLRTLTGSIRAVNRKFKNNGNY
jgi:hypothetical protein